MNRYLLLYCLFVIISFILLTGFSYAYWRREYEGVESAKTDMYYSISISIFASLIWPIGFLLCYCLYNGFIHGWTIDLKDGDY